MLLGYTITHMHVHVHTRNYVCIVQMYCTYLYLNLTQSIINCYMYPHCIHCTYMYSLTVQVVHVHVHVCTLYTCSLIRCIKFYSSPLECKEKWSKFRLYKSHCSPPPLLRIHVFQFFPLFNYYCSTLYVYSQTCTCNVMIHRFRRSCSWLWINGSWGTGTGLGTE